ncbi:MAG: PilZ domain-containing protein [Lachnospiraceae bacterium]|nr:PilZ domain-containing protein [Lachnospiraceae bacterium]
MSTTYEEKRKFKRLPINLMLGVDKLYKQDSDEVDDVNADIKVIDISKSGLGFVSKAKLPVGQYFNSTIGLGSNDYFRAVVKIVRESDEDNAIRYGAEFVGLAPFLQKKVDDYELRLVK